MNITITASKEVKDQQHLIALCQNIQQINGLAIGYDEQKYIEEAQEKDLKTILINQYHRMLMIVLVDEDAESARLSANQLHSVISKQQLSSVTIQNFSNDSTIGYAFAEGLALSNYQFLKYFKDKKAHALNEIQLNWDGAENDAKTLQAVMAGTYTARDLVNEPFSYLTAPQYSKDIEKLAKEYGFKVTVLHKEQIETLKMGGLLAVNKGSIDPPTFNIMEWKSANVINRQPIVLVGKGIVYDTGGLSLKPTANSMDMMKCDMGGSAAVVGTMVAIAKAKLDVHVIALVPATDNRPSGNAYAPGDVIFMHDGTSVEVLNTDAEGRLILADALSYAKQLNPELVIDLATLTGAAARAIGKRGIVAMGNDKSTMEALKKSGENVYERIAEFPFWKEYKDDLKSTVADLKNLGGAEAGAITAGKFLEHFTDYPYTHLDIAGPAFMTSPFNYRGTGGTGVGVRLLFDFLSNRS